jgi:TonB family protein
MSPHLLQPFFFSVALSLPLIAHSDTYIVIPQYSELTRMARIEGTVMVDLEFDKDGKIAAAIINTSKARIPMLEPIVLGAVSKWQIKQLANSKRTFSFTFNLLPESFPDANGEVASYVDIDYAQVKVYARKQAIVAVG